MSVILDGKIDREEYQSVCGSLSVLQRFAEAVRHSAASSKGNPECVQIVHLPRMRKAVQCSQYGRAVLATRKLPYYVCDKQDVGGKTLDA